MLTFDIYYLLHLGYFGIDFIQLLVLFRFIIDIIINHSVTLNQIGKEDSEEYNINHIDNDYLNEYLILTFRNVITQNQ